MEKNTMKISSAFPSTYMKAGDLQNRRVLVTIAKVVMKEIGTDTKLVAYFKDKRRGLVLNKTNANVIQDIAGTDETDDWNGVQSVLYPTKVDFQGRRVDAIRIERAAGGVHSATSNPEPSNHDFNF